MNNIHIIKIKTYVRHGDDWFYVSTINRESSVPMIPALRYNETIVWTYFWDGERGEVRDMIWQGEAPTGSIRTHQRVVELLNAQGAAGLTELDETER